MPGFYRIKFLPDGQEMDFAGIRGNYYELDDGTRIDMHTMPVWCHRCRKIGHGEKIESLVEIDRQIDELNDPSTLAYRMWTDNTFHEMFGGGDELRRRHIEKVRQRRRWREARSSPPKCVVCGSTDIFAFPIDQAVPHPEGAGTVEIKFVGMCSTEFNNWFFTSEGDRILRDTKPTYWHHPALDNSPAALRAFLKKRPLGNDTSSREAGEPE